MRQSILLRVACVCVALGAAACTAQTELPPGPTPGPDAASVSDAGGDADASQSADAGENVDAGGEVVDAGSDEDAGEDDGGTAFDAGPDVTVLFEDNFDQDGIPDPNFWSLVQPGGSNWDRHMSGSYDQAYVQGGKLILKAEKVGGVYKASGLHTKGKLSFTYGKVEVRAKFNSAQGGWPAIWMMPEAQVDYPLGGDIDIMQQINRETFVRSSLHSNYTDNLQQSANPPSSATAPFVANQFNTYSLEWTPDALIFSVNGSVSMSYPNLHLADEATQLQWPFATPFYLILDFALGGAGTLPGAITDSELPGSMEVDWVRVTQANSGGETDGGIPDGGSGEEDAGSGDADAGVPDAGPRVLFEENFDVDGEPDHSKWSLCPRGGSIWDRNMSGSYNQAYVQNGKLIVVGEKVSGAYVTGGIQTMGKFSFTYGKVEVSAKFHEVQGGWPAIWMMPEGPQNSPSCGEIDIMEQVSLETVFHATVHSHWRNDLGHYGPPDGPAGDPPSSVITAYNVGQFNTYGVEWTPETVTFTLNGAQTLSYPNLHLPDEATMLQWPFNKPFYIILNFALGGPGTWPGDIDDAELPGNMEVDWVRVTEL